MLEAYKLPLNLTDLCYSLAQNNKKMPRCFIREVLPSVVGFAFKVGHKSAINVTEKTLSVAIFVTVTCFQVESLITEPGKERIATAHVYSTSIATR